MHIKDKIIKINQDLQVHMHDNGYVLEASGYNHNDEYVTVRIVCLSIDEVVLRMKEASEMQRTD